MSRQEQIEEMSRISDGYLLIAMMDRYEVPGLMDLSDEQIDTFYESWKRRDGKKNERNI